MVTAGAVVPAVLVAFMAGFAIVRGGDGWFLRSVNAVFLMGLAIPLQATIIPVYLIIIRLQLYDTLLAIILPSIAFAIPLSVLVLSNFIRDVPKELFESMRMDGATEWGTMWHLAFPLTRPALVTVTVYNALGDLERLPAAAGPHPESGSAHPPVGTVVLPGPVRRQRAGRARIRRPHDPADPDLVRRGPSSAPQRTERRLQQVGRARTEDRTMAGFEASVVVSRPVEEVFEFVSDLEHDPPWSGAAEVHRTTPGAIGIGTTFRQRDRFLGRRMELTLEVIDYRPPQQITLKATSGRLSLVGTRMVEPWDEGSSRVTFLGGGHAKGPLRLTEPLLAAAGARRLRTQLARLKQVLEEQP